MWRLAEHPVAAAVRGLAFVLLSLVATAAAAGPGVKARILDVGLKGKIAAGAPATVRVEVSAESRFSGTFRGQLAQPSESRPDLEVRGMPSAEARFLLEAGETRVLTAYLPDLTDRSCLATQLRWTVDADDGRRRVAGVAPVVCLSSRFSPVRELYLTTEPLSPRQPPSEAPEDLQSYAGYDRCLITGRDFGRLREEQREALLDWVALGGLLILATPLDSSPGSIGESLASRGSLLWRDGAGHELRELPRHLGLVRSIDRPLEWLVTEGRSRSPLYRLLSFAGVATPRDDGGVLRGLPRAFGVEGSLPPPGTGRVGRSLPVVALLVLAIVGFGLRWTSRPRAATAASVVTVVAVLLVLAPGLVFVAVSSTPAGNEDRCASLQIHDSDGTFQSVWTSASLGGGGGSADPALSFAGGPRLLWTASRRADDEDSLSTIADIDGRMHVEIGRRGLAADRLIAVGLGQLQPADPVWDVSGALAGDGTIRALRSYTRVGFVGPAGIVWWGSVRRGDRIDIGRLRWPERPTYPKGNGSIDRVAALLYFQRYREIGLLYSWGYEARLPGSRPAVVVAAEPASCAVAVDAGGAFDVGPTIHVQPLPGSDPAGPLPAVSDGAHLRVQVPSVLLDRMGALGLELRPQAPYLDERVPPVVSGSAADGFREIAFHRIGATPPGKGAVLGRWRKPAPRSAPR
jgi:hypothetical protein